ncbi:MAG: hypothetical protein ABIQ93_09045, partial [Saprospiraceae bacterium]
FCALILITALAALPACKNDPSATTTATPAETINAPADPAMAVNQPDNTPIKLDYMPDKLAEAGGCKCNLTDDIGAAQEKVLLTFTMTNPATVMINGHLQTMEEQNPVNTAPNHRIIRVFKNENFVVSANLNPKGTVTDEKAMNEYTGEITIYNLNTKEMVSKNVKGRCGCK